MVRERALQAVLVLFGLLFLAGMIPIATVLTSKNQADAALPMLMSLYVALGVFLLLAVRNPSAHRSLIAYAAWANLAHGTVMAVQAFEFPRSPRFQVRLGRIHRDRRGPACAGAAKANRRQACRRSGLIRKKQRS